MTSLISIGFTVAGASAFGLLAISCFGCAVSSQSNFIAPRASARPRDVIYSDKKGTPQYRGNPWVGWIPWTLGLTYDEMLQGVPGTGTRNGGLDGRLLRVNLDGIVLLRFHELGMRITGMATLLFILILLPVYYTAECNGEGATRNGCAGTNGTITNYERLTFANVPSEFTEVNVLTNGYEAIRARLYSIVMVYWVLVAYTLVQLRQEWIEVLALRRVYYLEHDVWGSRKEELKETLLYESPQNDRGMKKSMTERDKGEEHLVNREPWIPHPEPRETVPNVALYSVLVGSLPDLPESKRANSRESLDWQLEMAVTFFDYCVPNQPGFSSSIAAVTIVPSASDLSNAWRKWYAAAAKLRRLRFIRELIAERRKFEIELEFQQKQEGENQDESSYFDFEKDGNDDTLYDLEEARALYGNDYGFDVKGTSADPESIYENPARFKDYYRAVLGILDENDDVHEFLKYGPEQAAVYSREFSQAAAPLCPRGFCEQLLRRMTIDDLIDLEEEIAEDVHAANLELKAARRKAALVPEVSEAPKLEVNDSSFPLFSRSRSARGSRHYDKSKQTKERKKPSVTLDNVPSSLQLEAQLYNKRQRGKSVDKKPLLKKSNKRKSDEGTSEDVMRRNVSGDQTETEVDIGEWDRYVSVVKQTQEEQDTKRNGKKRSPKKIRSGAWQVPTISSLLAKIPKVTKWTTNTSKSAVKSISSDATFAIVTFTSRQAAAAARHCLSDGRGTDRWNAFEDLPIPPLADAPAFNVLACRNCCRPLALGVNDRQKNLRYYLVLGMLGTIYCLYTIPLAWATELVTSDELDKMFPSLRKLSEAYEMDMSEILAGIIGAQVYTCFFALCPVMFKAIANFGSKATSVAVAEFRALQYYWWFMVLTAFSGQILTKITLSVFDNGLSVGSDFQTIVRDISRTIPSKVAWQWLNWIIFRMFAVLPFQYLLQVNTFLFSWLRMDCCARMVMGGGPGGPTPYRIYVDSGVVLMCCFGLGPASPLIAAATWLYFIIFQPMLRRNLIFMYRPTYDGGGLRWPFIFDMVISGMALGSILLAGQMGLKEALLPALLAAGTLVPIFVFQREMRSVHLRAFQDAALLQTSLLDGWNAERTDFRKREEFRRFLVDAHKAAYVPVCLAATDTDDMLTAEPAITIPLESDPDIEHDEAERIDPLLYSADVTMTQTEFDDESIGFLSPHPTLLSTPNPMGSTRSTRSAIQRRQSQLKVQKGATMRRCSMAGLYVPLSTNNGLLDDLRSQVSQSSAGSSLFSVTKSNSRRSSFVLPQKLSSAKPIKTV